MIKSDKEMKNNTYIIATYKASYQMPHLRIFFQDWAILSKRERYPLGRIRTPVKREGSGQMCTLTARLPTFHALKSDICLIRRYLM